MVFVVDDNMTISIHALREEGDGKSAQAHGPQDISIHALREEGDQRIIDFLEVGLNISIHALREEGDCFRPVRSTVVMLFLSTPSARRATYSEL